MLCTILSQTAAAKLPGAVHCYNDICHRVRTVAETAARRGIVEPLVASFYDSPENDRFNPSLETSSGTEFEPYAADNAASPIHPDGTVLLIWSPVTHGAAIVRVNNAGPYYPGRTLDVSRGTAERLGFAHGGTMPLLTVVIAPPTEPEAHYVRGRVYPKVPGYLGTFDNIALAGLVTPMAHMPAMMTTISQQPVSPTRQIALNVTEEHFRLTELALAFTAAPAETLPPPEPARDMMISAALPLQAILQVPADLYRAPAIAETDAEVAEDSGGGMAWTGVQRKAEAADAGTTAPALP